MRQQNHPRRRPHGLLNAETAANHGAAVVSPLQQAARNIALDIEIEPIAAPRF